MTLEEYVNKRINEADDLRELAKELLELASNLETIIPIVKIKKENEGG